MSRRRRSSARARAATTSRSRRSPSGSGAPREPAARRAGQRQRPAPTPTPPSATRPPWSCRGSATRSTRSTAGSSPCSTSAPTLGRAAGRAKRLAGRRAIHDPEREREVLLRVAMAQRGADRAGRPAVDLPPDRRRRPGASRRATATTTGGRRRLTRARRGAAPDDGGSLFVPAVTGAARPDPRVLPASPVTRFAPAPTGDLHLGHLVNALYTGASPARPAAA